MRRCRSSVWIVHECGGRINPMAVGGVTSVRGQVWGTGVGEGGRAAGRGAMAMEDGGEVFGLSACGPPIKSRIILNPRTLAG
jgi:hypothetical protein